MPNFSAQFLLLIPCSWTCSSSGLSHPNPCKLLSAFSLPGACLPNSPFSGMFFSLASQIRITYHLILIVDFIYLEFASTRYCKPTCSAFWNIVLSSFLSTTMQFGLNNATGSNWRMLCTHPETVHLLFPGPGLCHSAIYTAFRCPNWTWVLGMSPPKGCTPNVHLRECLWKHTYINESLATGIIHHSSSQQMALRSKVLKQAFSPKLTSYHGVQLTRCVLFQCYCWPTLERALGSLSWPLLSVAHTNYPIRQGSFSSFLSLFTHDPISPGTVLLAFIFPVTKSSSWVWWTISLRWPTLCALPKLPTTKVTGQHVFFWVFPSHGLLVHVVSVWGLQFTLLFWKAWPVASSGLILVTTAAVVECSSHHNQFCHRPFVFPVYIWTTTLSRLTFRSSFHLPMLTYLGESSHRLPSLHQLQYTIATATISAQLTLRSSPPNERCGSLCVTFLFVFSDRNYNQVLRPQSMCIYQIFYVSKVKPFHENPVSWLLCRLACFNLHHQGRAFQYMLDWDSYEWEERSSVPACHIFGPALNAKFEQGHPDQSVEVKSERLDVPHAQSSRTIFQIDPFFLALPATLLPVLPQLWYITLLLLFQLVMPVSCLVHVCLRTFHQDCFALWIWK